MNFQELLRKRLDEELQKTKKPVFQPSPPPPVAPERVARQEQYMPTLTPTRPTAQEEALKKVPTYQPVSPALETRDLVPPVKTPTYQPVSPALERPKITPRWENTELKAKPTYVQKPFGIVAQEAIDTVQEIVEPVARGVGKFAHAPYIAKRLYKPYLDDPSIPKQTKKEYEQIIELFAKEPETAGEQILETVGSLIPFVASASITAPFTAGPITATTGKTLAKYVPKLAQSAAGKGIARGLGTAVMGGTISAGREALKTALVPEEFDFQDTFKEIAGDMARFFAFGAAREVAGVPIKEGIQKIMPEAIRQGQVTWNLATLLSAAGGGAATGGTMAAVETAIKYMKEPKEFDAAQSAGDILSTMLFFAGLDVFFTLIAMGTEAWRPKGWQFGKAPGHPDPPKGYKWTIHKTNIQPGLQEGKFITGTFDPAKHGYQEIKKGMGVWVNPSTNEQIYEMNPVSEYFVPKYEMVRKGIIDTKVPSQAKEEVVRLLTSPTKPPGPIPGGLPQGRRTDLTLRAKVEKLSPEEKDEVIRDLRQRVYADELTGLKNRAAYMTDKKQPFQAIIDLDNLKWVNDNIGHAAGDTLIKTLAAELPEGSYRLSGDEFVVQGQSQEELNTVLSDIEARLKEQVVELEGDKQVVTKKGIGFSYGIGKTLDQAETALQQHKKTRLEAGERAVRGEKPEGIVEPSAAPAPEVPVPDIGPPVAPEAPPVEPKTVTDFVTRLDAKHNPDVPAKQAITVGDIRLDRYDPEVVGLFQRLGIQETGVRLGDAEETGLMRYMLEKGQITQADWDKHVAELRAEGKIKGIPAAPAPKTKPAVKEPWEMTREEFISGVPKGFKYIADLGETIARYNPDGTITLTDAFFGHNEQARKELLAHEKAHGIVNDIYANSKIFWDIVNSGLFGKYDSDAMKFKGVPYALRNVDEILTQLVADLQIGVPKKFRDKHAVQYNIAQQMLDGKEVDIKQAIQQALAEGKPIPEEVLADYPDLGPVYKNVTSEHLKYIQEDGTAMAFRPSKGNKKKPLEPVGKLEKEVMNEIGSGKALSNVSRPLIYSFWARHLGNKRRALINLLDRGVLKIEQRPEPQPIPGTNMTTPYTEYIVPAISEPPAEPAVPEIPIEGYIERTFVDPDTAEDAILRTEYRLREPSSPEKEKLMEQYGRTAIVNVIVERRNIKDGKPGEWGLFDLVRDKKAGLEKIAALQDIVPVSEELKNIATLPEKPHVTKAPLRMTRELRDALTEASREKDYQTSDVTPDYVERYPGSNVYRIYFLAWNRHKSLVWNFDKNQKVDLRKKEYSYIKGVEPELVSPVPDVLRRWKEAKVEPAPEPYIEKVPAKPEKIITPKQYLETEQKKHVPKFTGKKKDIVLHKAVIPKKPSLPILGYAVAKDGVLTSTDLEITVHSKTDLEDGVYALVGNETDLRLVKTEESLEETPVTKIAQGTKGQATLDMKELGPILQKATSYVSETVSRPALQNILLEVSGEEGIILASDTFRLTVNTIPVEGLKDGKYLILPKAAKVLTKDKKIDKVSIAADEKLISFDTGQWILTARIPEAEYPDIKNAVPKKTKQAHVFNKNVFKGKIKELLSMKPEVASNKVVLQKKETGFDATIKSEVTGKDYTVFIPAETVTGGSIKDARNVDLVLPIEISKEPEKPEDTIILNLKFLDNMVKYMPGKKLHMAWNNWVGPALFWEEPTVTGKTPKTLSFSKEIGDRDLYEQPELPKSKPKDVATRAKIIKAMHKFVPIRLGKVYKRDAAAIYKVREGVIRARTKYAQDLQVLSHEVGHHVDSLIDMKAAHFQSELLKVPYVQGLKNKYPNYPKKKLLAEGIAEYMRMWFTAPVQAEKMCPKLHKHFENTLYIDHPSIYNELANMQVKIQHYQKRLSDDPVERARARASELLGHDEQKPRGINNIMQLYKNESRVLARPLERFFTVFSDHFLPMELVEAKAKELNLEATEVWKYGRNETSQGFENTLINVGQPQMDPVTGMPVYTQKGLPKMVGDSFMDIVNKVARLGLTAKEGAEHIKGFEEYMLLRHSIEQEELSVTSGLMANDIPGKPTTLKHIKAAVRKIEETPEGKVYKEQAEKLFHREKGLRQYLYRLLEGIYSKEEIDKYLGKYELAVPMKRQNITQGGDKSKTTYAQRYLKKEKGSDLPVVSPLLSLLREIRAISKIHKTHLTNKTFFDVVKDLPKECGRFVEKVRLPVQVTKVPLQEVIEQLIAKVGTENIEGAPFALDEEGINDIILDIYRPIKKSQKNLIVHWNKGKAEAYEIFDKDLYNALLRVPGWKFPPVLTKLANIAATPFRIGHIVNTRWPFRNFVRDQQISFAHSEYGYIPVLSWLDGCMTLFFGHSKVGRKIVESVTKEIELDKNKPQLSIFKHFLKKEKDYMEMLQAMGASMESVDLLNEFDADKLSEKLAKKAWEQKDLSVSDATPWALMKAMVYASEMATNVGEAKMAIRKGADVLKGILSGKDITVDHNMSGRYTKDLKKIFPFGQPVFHGHYKLYRNMKNPEKRWRTLMKYFLAITLPTVINFYLTKDNPHMEEKPRWLKDWALLVPLGDPRTTDKFIPLPRAYGITGWSFGAFFHRLLDKFHKEDPRAFEEWGERFFRETMPGFTMWPITVGIELTANYDFYRRMPIETMGDRYKRKEDRYGPYTTEMSKLLGKTFKVSPRKIDHTVFQATGHLGRLLVRGIDATMRMLGIASRGEKPAPTMEDKWWFGPSISQTRASNANSIDYFYSLYDEAQLIDKPRNERERWLKDRLPAMQRIANDLAGLRKEVVEVHEDPHLSAEEKRKLIDLGEILQINLVRMNFGLEPLPLPEF